MCICIHMYMDICICKYIHMYVRDSFDVPLFVMIRRRQTRFTRSLSWLLLDIWNIWTRTEFEAVGWSPRGKWILTARRPENDTMKYGWMESAHLFPENLQVKMPRAEGGGEPGTPPPLEMTVK